MCDSRTFPIVICASLNRVRGFVDKYRAEGYCEVKIGQTNPNGRLYPADPLYLSSISTNRDKTLPLIQSPHITVGVYLAPRQLNETHAMSIRKFSQWQLGYLTSIQCSSTLSYIRSPSSIFLFILLRRIHVINLLLL